MSFKALTPNIIAANVNQSAGFYVDILGFDQVMSVPELGQYDFVMLKRDEVTLMIGSQSSFLEGFPQYVNHPIGGTMMLYFEVGNIQDIYETVIRNEVELLVDMNDTFYGSKEFAIVDNDGYILVFAMEVPRE